MVDELEVAYQVDLEDVGDDEVEGSRSILRVCQNDDDGSVLKREDRYAAEESPSASVLSTRPIILQSWDPSIDTPVKERIRVQGVRAQDHYQGCYQDSKCDPFFVPLLFCFFVCR